MQVREQGAIEEHARLVDRLNWVEARLAVMSRRPSLEGLTDPDPGGEERWDAARVWAHIAEFVPYWTRQVRLVLAGSAAAPVPFGRIATDPTRIDAIERDRLLPLTELWERVRESIGEVRRFIPTLSEGDWQRLGAHPRRGDVTVEYMFNEFIAKHLEEHAAQLEKLAAEAQATTA